MNTSYNNHTNVQENRNRYNELLQAALKRINDRKTDETAQEPEEVTTTATDVTTTTPTQQPESVATPEATQQEEPMHAPNGTDTESIYNADSLKTEVLTPKRAKELLGDNFNKLNTYVLVDGTHVVRFDRPELSNTLHIDDESPEYKEYQRGNISAVELYRNDAMSRHDHARDLDTIKRIPNCLKVLRGKDNVLKFSKYGGRYEWKKANPDEVEIYKAAAAAASEAFTKRLDSYLKRYGRKIYVHSYWADR